MTFAIFSPTKILFRRLALGCAMAVSLAAAPALAEKPADTAPQSFSLSNGMRVLVIPDHRAPVVTSMVWYDVGSADEAKGKTGLAHFLEHLMFKGTKDLAPGEFSKVIDRNGGTENAFTSYDYTAYYEVIARDRLPLVLKLEADRMANLSLTDKIAKTELDVVLEEYRMRIENNPMSKLSKKMDHALYGPHPYARRVIGVKQDVEGLTGADARAFYDRYYTPANATLVVAGDIDADELKPLAKKYFGVMKNRADRIERTPPPVKPLAKSVREVVRDKRVSEPVWMRTYLAPQYAALSPEEGAAFEVLGQILGAGTTSRLYKTLVVDQGIAASAQSWYSGGRRDSGEFGFYAIPRGKAGFPEIEKSVDAVIAGLLKDGVTGEELERAKTLIEAESVYARDDQMHMANAYGSALMVGVKPDIIHDWPSYVKQVTADDVMAAARKLFDGTHYVMGELLPEEKS
ncbi:pitrilysin family protein [Parvibaculum sp.]|uniref:M16 family metallopeptidase n=1 Tax=Parvibaculum sp. TaxID=2024848 RepID=UPI0025D28715|nr:pitrilysin family protein [Parvibaculum sp.]